jgi:hypothetical protein
MDEAREHPGVLALGDELSAVVLEDQVAVGEADDGSLAAPDQRSQP